MGCKVTKEDQITKRKKASELHQIHPNSTERFPNKEKNQQKNENSPENSEKLFPKKITENENLTIKKNFSSTKEKKIVVISNQKSTQTDNNYLEIYYQKRLKKEKEMLETLFRNLNTNSPNSPNLPYQPSILENSKNLKKKIFSSEKKRKISSEKNLKLPQIPLEKSKKKFNPPKKVFNSSRDFSQISQQNEKRTPVKVYKSMLSLLSPKMGIKSKQSLIANSNLARGQREIPIEKVKKNKRRGENEREVTLKIPMETSAHRIRRRSKTSIIQKSNPNLDLIEENRFKIFRTQKSKKSFKNKKKMKKKKKMLKDELRENFMRKARISRVLSSSSSSEEEEEEEEADLGFSSLSGKGSNSDCQLIPESPVHKIYQFPPLPSEKKEKKNLKNFEHGTPSSQNSKFFNSKIGVLSKDRRLDSVQTNKEDKDFSINTVSIKGRRNVKNTQNSIFKERKFSQEKKKFSKETFSKEDFSKEKNDDLSPEKLSNRNSKLDEISPLLGNTVEKINHMNTNSASKIKRKTSNTFYRKRDDIIKSHKLIELTNKHRDFKKSKSKPSLNPPKGEENSQISEEKSPRKRNFSNIPEVEEEKDISVSNRLLKSRSKMSSSGNLLKEKSSKKRLLEEKNNFVISVHSPEHNDDMRKVSINEEEMKKFFKNGNFEDLTKEEMIKMKTNMYRKKRTIVKNTPEIIVSEGFKLRRRSQLSNIKEGNSQGGFKRQLSMMPLGNAPGIGKGKEEMENSDFMQD